MKLSRPFWGAMAGASLCLLGIAGVIYFQQDWGGAAFWQWFPLSVAAVCLGALAIIGSLFGGLISGLVTRLRRRSGHNTSK